MWVLLLLTFLLWYRFAVGPSRRWRRAGRNPERPASNRHTPPMLTRSYHR